MTLEIIQLENYFKGRKRVLEKRLSDARRQDVGNAIDRKAASDRMGEVDLALEFVESFKEDPLKKDSK